MHTGKLVAIAACLSFAGMAHAQAVQPDYSADDFVKAILSGPQPCPKTSTLEQCEANPKTRRFSLASPKPDKPVEPRRSANFTSAPVEPVKAKKLKKERDDRPLVMTARLSKPKVTSGDVLVTFATGSADITPQGQANLQSIATGLNKPALSALTFEVAGFTDLTGNSAFNRKLSQRRADAVKAYLVALKVSPERLSTAGYGSDHLAKPDDPAAEANRRVELHRLN